MEVKDWMTKIGKMVLNKLPTKKISFEYRIGFDEENSEWRNKIIITISSIDDDLQDVTIYDDITNIRNDILPLIPDEIKDNSDFVLSINQKNVKKEQKI